MKRWIVLPLALLLWPAVASAQEEEAEEAAYSPTWWAVITEQVKPSMVEQYEGVSGEFMELIRANAPEGMEYYTLSGPETGYLYAIPMKSMNEFMELGQSWQGMIEKIGRDTWNELEARSDACVDHRSLDFYVQRDDLSYQPETPRLAEEEAKIRHYDWIYVIPGKERAMMDVMKEWVELYKANDVNSGWMAYQAVSGDDLPMFVVSTRAKSPVDYLTDGERIDELLGDADEALWAKTRVLMRDFEHNNAWVREDLSLVQEEM